LNNEFISIENISEHALNQINEQHIGLSTGLYELDNKIRGLKPSEYVIIAARPAMGKTSLATNIALAAGQDYKVIFFSIEMNPVMLAQRMLANIAEVNLYDFHQGKMLPSAWGKLKEAKLKLVKRNIWFDGSSYITPCEIANKLSQIDDYDIIIIDYIQLMGNSAGTKTSRVEEMSGISRQLKALAKDIDKPMVVLSQLNRSPDMRENHRPFLSDLRDSGSLEQDADIVLFIYRGGYYYPSKDDGSTEVIIAKNRNGPTGKVNCYFNKELARFEEYKMKEGW